MLSNLGTYKVKPSVVKIRNSVSVQIRIAHLRTYYAKRSQQVRASRDFHDANFLIATQLYLILNTVETETTTRKVAGWEPSTCVRTGVDSDHDHLNNRSSVGDESHWLLPVSAFFCVLRHRLEVDRMILFEDAFLAVLPRMDHGDGRLGVARPQGLMIRDWLEVVPSPRIFILPNELPMTCKFPSV